MRMSHHIVVAAALSGMLVAGCGKKSSGSHDDKNGAQPIQKTEDQKKDDKGGTPVPPNGTPPADETPAADDSAANGNGNGANTTPAVEPDRRVAPCETAWPTYLASHKKGLVKAYQQTTTVKGDPNAKETKRIWRETVTEATGDTVTTERVDQTLAPTPGDERKSTKTLNKNEYINTCIAASSDPASVTTEILASKTEKITVEAGPFDTDYVKSKQSGEEDGTAYSYLSEVWTVTGSIDLVAKSVSEWTTTMNGAPYTEVTTMELTKLERP